MGGTIQILSTRPLDKSIISDAAAKGIQIDERAFIETTPVEPAILSRQLDPSDMAGKAVVFTSMNAVEAVQAWLQGTVHFARIYCIGNTTRELVLQYFGGTAIAGTAMHAAELAAVIIQHEIPGEIIFFCGDQRRDELPDILTANGFMLREWVVYKTIPQPAKIDTPYDGILFFSPSAVDSFFLVNSIPPQTVLFAIGKTTGEAIGKYTSNRVILSPQPGKSALAEEMIRFYTTDN